MIGEEECEIPPFQYTRKSPRVDITKIPSNFQSVDSKDVCVFIDPLDATKEFTVGNLEGVITLIGIAYRGITSNTHGNNPN
jgi:3'-phosphoadenosine 5'-phosphosulfate (PAPS) 3'-phosphatase